MHIEAVADNIFPGDWRVEELGEDGEVHIAIFSGPLAEQRAKEYLLFRRMSDGQPLRQPHPRRAAAGARKS